MTATASPPGGPRRDPPPVTVTGGPAAPADGLDVLDADPTPSRTGPWIAGAVAVVVLLAALGVSRAEPPPEPEPLAVALRLVPEEISGSQSGVLVLPVAVRPQGDAEVRVDRAVVWAEPVREQPTATGRTRFAAAGSGRLRVLLQPDCRLLVPDSGIAFAATLAVDVTGVSGREASAVLDLAAEPVLAGRISALCRPGDGMRVRSEPQAPPAQPPDDGAAAGCPQGLCTGARDALRG